MDAFVCVWVVSPTLAPLPRGNVPKGIPDGLPATVVERRLFRTVGILVERIGEDKIPIRRCCARAAENQRTEKQDCNTAPHHRSFRAARKPSLPRHDNKRAR
eukprot:151490-Rhodomonas_salina.1